MFEDYSIYFLYLFSTYPLCVCHFKITLVKRAILGEQGVMFN